MKLSEKYRHSVEGQIFLPLPEFDPETAPEVTFKNVLEEVKRDLARIAERETARLREAGFQIFPVQRENDFISHEGDYGAPGFGLKGFKVLLHPSRSFRYERVHDVEGSVRTHVAQSIAIGKTLKRQGFKIFEGLDEEQFPTQIYFANGGVTRAFSDTIQAIINSYSKNREALGEGNELLSSQAALLVPVPTYGLFLWRMREAIKGTNIRIIGVNRNENGAVNIKSLQKAMQYCREENIRILSYYDCNPHNPTGYIRQKAETQEVAEILDKQTQEYIRKSEEFYDSASRKERLSFELFLRPFSGITIIDDMAYEGLQYNPRIKPYSFGQVSQEFSESTVVLRGISKIGFPGARIGLMLGHSAFTEPLNQHQLMTEFSAASMGVDMLAARFNTQSPHRKYVVRQEARLRKEHIFKAGIFETFFKGLDHTDKLTLKEKDKLVKLYADHAGISCHDSQKKLNGGLAPFSLPINIGCGFFTIVDLGELYGHSFAMKFNEKKDPMLIEINNSNHLYWALRSFGIHVVSGGGMGCDPSEPVVRMSFSLPEKELFNIYDQMYKMREHFFGKNPEVQLNLFNKTYPLSSHVTL